MTKSTKDTPTRKGPRFKKAAKAAQQQVKRDVVAMKENLPIDPKTGKRKHGAIKELMAIQRQLYPWFTRDILNKALKKYKREEKQPLAFDQRTSTELSSARDDAPAPGDATENGSQPKKAGRPTGTSSADKRASTQAEEALMDDVCRQYGKAKENAGDQKLRPGTLGEIISKCKSELKLQHCIVSEETVRTRYKRGNLSNVHRGHHSPIAEIEGLIVEVVKKSNRARNPLDKLGVIGFVNSLITGGPLEERVAEFKRKNVSAYATEDRDDICAANEVGDGWYYGFRKRWVHELG
jgi:hypothetical protein